MKYNFDEYVERRNMHSAKWSPEILEDNDVLPLWLADMDFRCPQPVIDSVVRMAAHGVYGYSTRPEAYYSAIINWNRKRHGWHIERDWILFSPGVVPALSLLVQTFCAPGDKVIIQNPVYYPFYDIIRNNGCHPVMNPLRPEQGKYRMDLGSLEELAKDPKAKLLMLCSPHNPVGRVWTQDELSELGKIALGNNLLVVSDEIHSDLVFKGHKHIPFQTVSEDFAQHSIACTAPSKTFNIPGLRVSSIIIPNEGLRQQTAQAFERVGAHVSNGLGIAAATAGYEEGEEWLEQLLSYLEDNLDFLGTFIEKKMPEISLTRPEGTYLAWLDFRAIEQEGRKLDEFLRKEAKVVLDKGHVFGEGGEGFARLNFACPRTTLAEALRRIQQAVKGISLQT